ncbi:hypothetical protein LCGC14_1961820 [marine sediment metagenome]|uniref:Uncharacterized protein n=1 Tax=marine sediment metagenome TaxID=412755 RepID=A0A0F9FE98_9ZZZZ
MGHFLAVSAFRTEQVDELCQRIAGYCRSSDVGCEVRESADDLSDETDATVYSPENGWVRVIWPNHFTANDFPLCENLSKQAALVVSTVHTYDGEYWEHLFLDRGDVLHKFCSWPDYDVGSEEEAVKAKAEWRGDPTQLAEFLGIPAESISGYMVHLSPPPAEPPPKKSIFSWLTGKSQPQPQPQFVVETHKAYDADHFDLEDFWVFTDFWAKLGIVYPDPWDQGIGCLLRFEPNWWKKLPSM